MAAVLSRAARHRFDRPRHTVQAKNSGADRCVDEADVVQDHRFVDKVPVRAVDWRVRALFNYGHKRPASWPIRATVEARGTAAFRKITDGSTPATEPV